jgi:hypothetical protein
MTYKTVLKLASSLKKDIGKDYRMIGKGVKSETYQNAVAASDQAQHLAIYLIQHLADRHQAKVFASAVGMPSYFYQYKG